MHIAKSESIRRTSGCVGELGKTLHPRNVGFAETREISSRITLGMRTPVS
jgi:hypothetical protein